MKFYKNFEILNLFENSDFLEISKFYYPLPIIINIYWTPSLPMVFWPPCPWNIDPRTMVYQILLWYYELLSFGRNEGGSIYHEGVQNTMTNNWPQGQNIIGKSTPGSICHGVQNTIWHRSPFSKWSPQYHKNSTLFDFKGSF